MYTRHNCLANCMYALINNTPNINPPPLSTRKLWSNQLPAGLKEGLISDRYVVWGISLCLPDACYCVLPSFLCSDLKDNESCWVPLKFLERGGFYE